MVSSFNRLPLQSQTADDVFQCSEEETKKEEEIKIQKITTRKINYFSFFDVDSLDHAENMSDDGEREVDSGDDEGGENGVDRRAHHREAIQ